MVLHYISDIKRLASIVLAFYPSLVFRQTQNGGLQTDVSQVHGYPRDDCAV